MFLSKSGSICEDTPRCERIPGATKGIVPSLFSEPIISDRNETERDNTCVFNTSSKMTRISNGTTSQQVVVSRSLCRFTPDSTSAR